MGQIVDRLAETNERICRVRKAAIDRLHNLGFHEWWLEQHVFVTGSRVYAPSAVTVASDIDVMFTNVGWQQLLQTSKIEWEMLKSTEGYRYSPEGINMKTIGTTPTVNIIVPGDDLLWTGWLTATKYMIDEYIAGRECTNKEERVRAFVTKKKLAIIEEFKRNCATRYGINL